MDNPVVISATKQEFEGLNYYLCGNYFQREGVRLHRLVWQAAHGQIPEGFEIHHRDENRANNALDNLALLKNGEHQALHGQTTTNRQREARRVNSAAAIEGNKLITAEERGAASKKGWEGMTTSPVNCKVCGNSFETYFPSRARICSPACTQKDLRRRRREERQKSLTCPVKRA